MKVLMQCAGHEVIVDFDERSQTFEFMFEPTEHLKVTASELHKVMTAFLPTPPRLRTPQRLSYFDPSIFRQTDPRVNLVARSIRFNSRDGAEKVLEALSQKIEANGMVTIGEMNELSGLMSDFRDYTYGWSSIKGFSIEDEGGADGEPANAILKFPLPNQLESKEV